MLKNNYQFFCQFLFFKYLVLSILIFQLACSINFWRYVFTNSPGETNIEIITSNAYLFTIITLFSGILIFKSYNKL